MYNMNTYSYIHGNDSLGPCSLSLCVSLTQH